MLIVDSQVHIWAAETPDRPWSPLHAGAAQRAEPFSADDLLTEMRAAGVKAAVLVPPSWEGTRNELALDAARRHPARFAVMGRLPLEHPDSRDRMAEWPYLRGLFGARVNFRPAASRAWLQDGTADWLWRQAERDGLCLMVFAPHDLLRIGAVAAAHPNLRIALDHMALSGEEKGEAAFANLPDLLALARHPNIAVKASALPCVAADDYPYRSLHEPIRRVVDAFGPERVFWGSDLTRLPCSYSQAVRLFTEELPWLSGAELEAVMGGAICDWLDWPAPRTLSDATM
ncbi:amidohydrolase family protein [Muricoccus radiodurans]|uniref:amidohydrolase family protein n=1 Tax=Muricoccus radiodurans TaxID=2231721 RepID=UPI003CF16159